MFELPWSHLFLFGLAALVLIPTKDLPKVLRQAGRYWSDLQRMAREFRAQISEALRESELHEIKEGLTKDLQDIQQTASMNEEQAAWNASVMKAASTSGTQPETRSAPAASASGATGQIVPPAGAGAAVVVVGEKDDAASYGSGATVPMASLSVASAGARKTPAGGLAARVERTEGIDVVRAGRGSVAQRAAAAWKKAASDAEAGTDSAANSSGDGTGGA